MATQEQILDAYDRLARRPGSTVRIIDLRDELGWPDGLDEVLITMAREGLIILSHDQYKLSAEEHASAVTFGGQMHLMMRAEGDD